MRAALKVALPEGFHVQSNKPRDASLIPTELTVEGPSGIQVDELVFPIAVDFPQEGLDQPLLVFDREFTIGVRLALPANLPPGEVTVPARLRYQACDDKMCYAPSNAQASWTLKVVPAGTSVAAQHGDVLDKIAFGTGEKPAQAAAAATAASLRARPRAGRTPASRNSTSSRSSPAPAAISAPATSSPSSRTPKPASSRRGCSKGRGRSPSC